MSSAEIYAKEVHDQLLRYAAWLPTEKVSVGDIGVLQNNIFSRQAHLKDLGIDAKIVKDPATDAAYKFMSAETTETEVSAGAGGTVAQGVSANVDLKIGFARENSVYFFITKCVGSAIENQLKLGTEILKRVKTKDWKLDYVVITRVVTAGSATILQAKSRNASVVFGGTAQTSGLQLLNAGASVNVRSGSFNGFSVITQSGLTPLMSLGKVDYGWKDWVLRREPKFSPATNVKTAKIGVSRLAKLVDATPHIIFASPPGTNSDHEELTVMLPRYGEHVDIDNLVEFAFNARSGGKSEGYELKSIGRLSSTDLCNTRIEGKRIRSLVSRMPNIELESQLTDEDFFHLNITLPKSGSSVDFEPLLDLAVQAVEPRATATATAEFLFHEID